MTDEVTINILSLNCWGIPYVSKNREDRMKAIAEKFATENYDVICLQEVWSVNDFKMIKARTQEQLPYSHYFYSGVLGSGICVLSKYPIEDVMFHKWTLNGYVHKVHHGDWFGGKGVGLCRLKIHGMTVNIYTVHLHAEYNRHNDEYIAHRVLQAFDTAQFIRMTCGGADFAILGGDLNTEPQDLAYKIICGVAGLSDACSSVSNNLGTNECANNSYTSSKLARKVPEGKRIDHILYLSSKLNKVEVVNFHHPFPKRVPYKDFSYSDHEAVMATLKLSPGLSQPVNVDIRDSLKEAINICETSLKSVRRHRILYLIFACVLTVPLVCSMGLDCTIVSVGVNIGLNVIRVFLSAMLCYTLFMSTIWNSVEKNALKAGRLEMEIYLTNLNNNLLKK
ncbi:neutral sphingomyelinase [Nomia melanderi]|uniref:neutral sphingomyelinase n=1 Tax=Nomia melanderi TaxID=2448451 RepID=UPI001304237C|nr:putative neutral sphingomyelinase [Nomia melanderi]XP_031840232.1 putative neutral sphingomyelinase [Nomia melanderi]